eukprot:637689-Rhodomonas_salina.3
MYFFLVRLRACTMLAACSTEAAVLSAWVCWYQESLSDAEQSLGLQPSLAKGHYRRGVALAGLGRYPEVRARSVPRGPPLSLNCTERWHPRV